MATIKNIIFDLGGVLLNIDYLLTAKAFKGLGIAEFEELYSQFTANELFEKFETGMISEEAFYHSLHQYRTPPLSPQEIEIAWNAMLLDFRKETLDFLTRLKNKYKLYLLSNTNIIHLRGMERILLSQTGLPSLQGYFIKSYYSHLINRRKPYPDTYKFVLNDGNMKAEETLFIDDSIHNIEGAREAGLLVHYLLPGERIEELGL